MSIELPRLSIAEGASLLLCVLCALVLELALARLGGSMAGSGIAAGVATLAWLWHSSLRATRALRSVALLADDRWRLEFRDGRVLYAPLGPGTRVMGRTLVLDWIVGGPATRVWLTRWDVADGQLRAVAARLACGSGLRAA
jgi:hypothetical protein